MIVIRGFTISAAFSCYLVQQRPAVCVWGLCVCTGCTMCGVTEVTLNFFTVLENSVASVGVTSYYVMGRNVSGSRCRAVPWLRRLVAGRSPRSAGLHSGPVSVRLLIYTTSNCMLFVPCLFLQSYYHLTHVAYDALFMTSTPTCFGTKVS